MGNGKIRQNSTRHKIETPKPIRKKTCHNCQDLQDDPVCQIWYHSAQGGLRGSYPKISVNICYIEYKMKIKILVGMNTLAGPWNAALAGGPNRPTMRGGGLGKI